MDCYLVSVTEVVECGIARSGMRKVERVVRHDPCIRFGNSCRPQLYKVLKSVLLSSYVLITAV